MKAVVAAFNQEKALVGAFSVITNIRMELFGAILDILYICTWTPVMRRLHSLESWPCSTLNLSSAVKVMRPLVRMR